MRNSRLSLLVVATVAAIILVAGCTSSNQQSSSSQGTSTPSTSTSVATSSSVASASPTVKPSASASPTASTSPTPTPTPQPSGKIATSIDGTPSFNSNPTITRNSPVSWGFEVVPTGQAQVLSVPVTVRIDNKAIGQVTPLSGGTATAAFSLTSAETNSLAVGQHTLTVSFAGDSTYQPSEQSFQITVT